MGKPLRGKTEHPHDVPHLVVQHIDPDAGLLANRRDWEALASRLAANEITDRRGNVRTPRTSALIRAALDRDRGAMVRVTLGREAAEAVLRRAG